jgi:hypothetical protein
MLSSVPVGKVVCILLSYLLYIEVLYKNVHVHWQNCLKIEKYLQKSVLLSQSRNKKHYGKTGAATTALDIMV